GNIGRKNILLNHIKSTAYVAAAQRICYAPGIIYSGWNIVENPCCVAYSIKSIGKIANSTLSFVDGYRSSSSKAIDESLGHVCFNSNLKIIVGNGYGSGATVFISSTIGRG